MRVFLAEGAIASARNPSVRECWLTKRGLLSAEAFLAMGQPKHAERQIGIALDHLVKATWDLSDLPESTAKKVGGYADELIEETKRLRQRCRKVKTTNGRTKHK